MKATSSDTGSDDHKRPVMTTGLIGGDERATGAINGSDLGNPRADDRDRARTLLILVQALAEGARHDRKQGRRRALTREPAHPRPRVGRLATSVRAGRCQNQLWF